MTRWRVVDLRPGDMVPPRVHVGVELVLEPGLSGPIDDVAELVERAASAAGVKLARIPIDDPHER